MDAIVGLPISGKTTVFRALTRSHGSAGGDRRGEHVGVVKLKDDRLEKLAELFRAKKVTPHEVRLDDLPPLFGRGAAPTPEAREALSKADTLLHVVRAFHREDVPHPEGTVDPQRDIAAFDAEIALQDLGVIERRLEKLDITVRSARPGEREAGEREQALLERCRRLLEDSKQLRDEISDTVELKGLANYGLVSLKPMLVLLNIDEVEAANAEAIEQAYSDRYAAARTSIVAMCAKLEADLAELQPAEAEEFRREMKAGDSPADRVFRRLQDLLGLTAFYTVVGDECRVWMMPSGTTALQAAGRIHTDMERGFIRAEVIQWDRLLDLGSLAEAKKHGALRTEGKHYPVQDGDVLHILFHV